MKKFNINEYRKSKKGESGVKRLISIVVLVILIAVLAPVALPMIFNTTAYGTNVPAWVPLVLGILAVIAFIYILLDAE